MLTFEIWWIQDECRLDRFHEKSLGYSPQEIDKYPLKRDGLIGKGSFSDHYFWVVLAASFRGSKCLGVFVRIFCRSKLPQQWNPTVNCSEGRSKIHVVFIVQEKIGLLSALGFGKRKTTWGIGLELFEASEVNLFQTGQDVIFYVPFTMVYHKGWVEDVCRLPFKAFWGSFACVFVVCFLLGADIWGEIPPKLLRTPKIWVRNPWKSTIIMYQICVCICIVCVYIHMYIDV